MNDLNSNISNLKKNYREIFMKSAEALNERIEALRPEGYEGDFLDDNPKWHKDVLKMFDDEIAKDIFIKWQEILAYRKHFHCKGCATCCNLACSEFSPEQLQLKKQNNDNFATQFLSVFIPYDNKEDARNIYPDYIKMLEDNKEDEVYFYHCPKLNECKRCSDYENRPQICRDFPDNPLSILPESCGYYEWKKEVEPVALMCHSMMEIIDFYKQNIQGTL